jgi:hypothetical protein
MKRRAKASKKTAPRPRATKPRAPSKSSARPRKSVGRKPLTIRRLTLPVEELRRLSVEQRSAILLLGHFINEANWLRKLLAGAVSSIGDRPDGQANFALVVQLAAALAGKIHEGWKKVQSGSLAKAIHSVPMPDDLKGLRKEVNRAVAEPTIRSIRNSYSFHYPDVLDIEKLASIDDLDSVLYVTDSAWNGDIFSHLSSIIALEPLLKIHTSTDWREALVKVWDEVLSIAGNYCFFLGETLALVIGAWLPGKVRSAIIIERKAATITDLAFPFFVHPPSNLEELREQVAVQEKRAAAKAARTANHDRQ